MALELGKNLFVHSFVLRNLETCAWSGLDGCIVMSLPWLEWLGCLQRLRWPAPIMRDSYIGPRPGNEITWWRLAPLDFLLTASIFLPS